jgi:hypothetical protein
MTFQHPLIVPEIISDEISPLSNDQPRSPLAASPRRQRGLVLVLIPIHLVHIQAL